MKTSTGTVPELARQWFEAQENGGVFPKKLDRALLEAPATSVRDVVALLEVVKRDFTIMHSDSEGGIALTDVRQQLMWKAINDAHRLLTHTSLMRP